LAFLTSLATVFALVVPLVGTAGAVTPDNTFDLDTTPDQSQVNVNTQRVLTATIAPACNDPDGNGCEIDFEVESGDPVTFTTTATSTTSGVSDADNSPTSPDATCTVPDTLTACTISFTSSTSGTRVLRSWVDDNKDNADGAGDFDATEGRNPGPTDDGGSATGAVPGSRTEIDDTDVVEVTFFSPVPGTASLDCDDSSGESAGDPELSDLEINPPGSPETYTCTAVDNKGTVSRADDTPISGINIDGENMDGANDPDNSADNATPDYNNVGVTNASGQATFAMPTPDLGEVGPADFCFWLDDDNDNVFDVLGVNDNDGDECNSEAYNGGEASNGGAGDDTTDVVRLTLGGTGAEQLQGTPEVQQVATGATVTVTGTVLNSFLDPVSGVPVDFINQGARNAALGLMCDDVVTNANGQASCTYTDTGALGTAGTDLICISGDADNGDNCDDATEGRDEGATPGGTAEPDMTDLVLVQFTPGGPPAVDEIRIDMDDHDTDLDTVACPATDFDAAAAANDVLTSHEVCVQVEDATNAVIPGVQVTLTITGPGFFTDALNADLGQSIVVTTDENGNANALIRSAQTGTTTVTATSGSKSAAGTKPWQALNPRNIACTPDTQSGPPGSSRTISCLLTDRLSNPVPLYNSVVFQFVSGPGQFSTFACGQADCFVGTNSLGIASIVVETTSIETGDTVIRGEISDDYGDVDSATDLNNVCDQPADDPDAAGLQPGQQPGAPAGNCEDDSTISWEEVLAECADGVDNDGDGAIDFPADPGCSSAEDDSESPVNVLVNSGPCAGQFQDSRTPKSGGAGLIIVGTPGADILNGTGGNDTICGLGGADLINGRGGSDVAVGNGGADTVEGGRGGDSLKGNRGGDTLRGQRGGDLLLGNAGNDLLVGGKGRDTCRGGPGRDRLRSCEQGRA
jgi:hypothetical protein